MDKQVARRTVFTGLAGVGVAVGVGTGLAQAAPGVAGLRPRFYQPLLALNGFATDCYAQLLNETSAVYQFAEETTIKLAIRHQAGPQAQRMLTRYLTSWGHVFHSFSGVDESDEMIQTFEWVIPKGIRINAGCRIDMVFGIGDGLVRKPRRGRLKNYVTMEGLGISADSRLETVTPFGKTDGIF